jgi:hypothetical protein
VGLSLTKRGTGSRRSEGEMPILRGPFRFPLPWPPR